MYVDLKGDGQLVKVYADSKHCRAVADYLEPFVKTKFTGTCTSFTKTNQSSFFFGLHTLFDFIRRELLPIRNNALTQCGFARSHVQQYFRRDMVSICVFYTKS